MTKEYTYSIDGMHCAACEVLIEKKLLALPGVKAVNASTAQGKATIEYEGEKPTVGALNQIFKKDHYTFFEGERPALSRAKKEGISSTLIGFAVALALVIGFLFLGKLGISGFLTIASDSSLVTFFGFGLLAGLSSCAALVGGIMLSMSKQWMGLYTVEQGAYRKLQPHVLFTVGRIVSYGILGGALGLIGSRIALSFQVTAILVMVISLVMIVLGLQMLGVPGFRKFQIGLPKFITRYIANESHFQAKYMPLVMGALTFFLPCGFTVTAQTIALLSQNTVRGALIMLAFVLGTTPILLLIGASSVAFLSKPRLAMVFSQTAGFLVLFFALYNIYTQASVLGWFVR